MAAPLLPHTRRFRPPPPAHPDGPALPALRTRLRGPRGLCDCEVSIDEVRREVLGRRHYRVRARERAVLPARTDAQRRPRKAGEQACLVERVQVDDEVVAFAAYGEREARDVTNCA